VLIQLVPFLILRMMVGRIPKLGNTHVREPAAHALCPVLRTAGQPMLLPLSQSLYVEGELADANSVLLDIGTGYYLEVRSSSSALFTSEEEI